MLSSYVVITKYVACIRLNVMKSDKLCYVVDQWKVIVTSHSSASLTMIMNVYTATGNGGTEVDIKLRKASLCQITLLPELVRMSHACLISDSNIKKFK